MSTIELFFLLLGMVATVVFFAGYYKGTMTAIKTHAEVDIETDDSLDIQNFWFLIALAVFTSALIIALVGVFPAFIYLGPALAMVTAIMNGIAFFIE